LAEVDVLASLATWQRSETMPAHVCRFAKHDSSADDRTAATPETLRSSKAASVIEQQELAGGSERFVPTMFT